MFLRNAGIITALLLSYVAIPIDGYAVKVGDFGDGYVVRLECVQPTSGRIGLDFTDGNNDDILLHVNPRITENVLVLNSRFGGSWGREERPPGFPISPGAFTVITVTAKPGYFEIDVNNGQFTYNYAHRAPVSRITKVGYWTNRPGPLDDETLEAGKVLDNFEPGKVVYVEGTAPTTGQFVVNFISALNSDDIAFHFAPQFDQNTVIRNTVRSGQWDSNAEKDGGFPFTAEEEFSLMFVCQDYGYEVAVNGEHFTTYLHRLPYTQKMIVMTRLLKDIKKIDYD